MIGTLACNNMNGLGRPGTGTLKVDRPQLSPADIQKLAAAQRNNKTSE